jgi:hypothetical protein
LTTARTRRADPIVSDRAANDTAARNVACLRGSLIRACRAMWRVGTG